MYYVSCPLPPTGGRHIVFGSVVCVMVCVIPCEHDNRLGGYLQT